MGGDGGVVATNRRYMRGAGSASHTADSKRASASAIAEAERESIVEMMKTCAITGGKLNYKEDIVACPYGKLYGKEAAVKALLRRLEEERNGNSNDATKKMDLGWHVRGLKDLKPVRFHIVTNKLTNGESKQVPICPVTSIELSGMQPVFLIVQKKLKKKKKDKNKDNDDPKREDQPNVLSEKAIKQMGIDALQEEYGPFDQDDLLRLAPPPGQILDNIKSRLEEKRIEQESEKTKKKRKLNKNSKEQNQKSLVPMKLAKKPKPNHGTKSGVSRTVNDVRNDVAAAVASSAALSSLFTDKQSALTEKEKKDSLFSCNC